MHYSINSCNVALYINIVGTQDNNKHIKLYIVLPRECIKLFYWVKIDKHSKARYSEFFHYIKTCNSEL